MAGPSVELLDPLTDPMLDAPVSKAADAARGTVGWPCLTCGASVGLDQDICQDCGAPFMAGGADAGQPLRLPLIGSFRPSGMSKAWLIIGGSLVMCLVLIALLSLVGLFL